MVTLRSLALSVYLPTFILSLCSGLLLPVLPVYARSFGASYSVVGLILAGEAIGSSWPTSPPVASCDD